MSRYSGRDSYTDPATGVLKNRLGITDETELEQTEAQFVAARSSELARDPIVGSFDLQHLRSIHRYLFGDIYDWAGQLRTVDISKGGNRFAHYAYIESASAPLFAELTQERRLQGLAPAAFCARAAHYLGELNALHPFRDGNGRAQRELVSQLAHLNSYHIAWENLTQQQMLEASIRSFSGDCALLAALLSANLQPLDPLPQS
jgi:cell filamentation protein